MFKAWSVIDRFMGQEQVRMDWFVVGRTEPPAPWDEIILDYDEEDDNAVYDRIMVMEWLSEAEVEQLAAYLEHKHQLALNIEEVKLPVKSGGLSHGLLLISGETGFYPLAEEEGYPLAVAVLGHYDGRGVETLRCLSMQELNAGRKLLQYLSDHCSDNIVDRLQDEELLKKIYAETGLKVIQD